MTARDTAIIGTQVSLWNDLLHPEGKSETARYLHYMLEPTYTLYEQVEFGFPNQQNYPPNFPSANSPLTEQIPYGSWGAVNSFAEGFTEGLDIIYSGSNFDMGMTPGNMTPPDQPGNPFITVGGESYVDSVSRWIVAYEDDLTPSTDRRYWIHENRAGLDPSYGSYPAVDESAYRDFVLGASSDWYEDLLSQSRDANPSVEIDILPTGSAWASVWENVVPSMTFADWFRDSDHGHAWTHAVYAAAVYSKMYGDEAPDISAQLVIDGAPFILTDNWTAITAHIMEFIYDGPFPDEVDDFLPGTDTDDVIDGDAGDDTIEGFEGNDILTGGDGEDSISGGSGSDTLDGGAGQDVIHGGDNGDALRGDGGNDRMGGGQGSDRVVGGEGDDTLRGGNGQDTVLGGDGDDRLFGGRLDDSISGGAGNDEISGQKGDDILNGGAGADTITGGSHNDTISGGTGDDVIDAGTWRDTVTGGDGADFFFLGTNYNRDVITDFTDNEDTLLLDSRLWSGTLSAEEVVDQFSILRDGDVVLDFGQEEFVLRGVSDAGVLVNDIDFV